MPFKVSSKEQMHQFVHDALKRKDANLENPFVVTLLESDAIVGTTRFLNISEENRQLEIGWTWYQPSVWRTAVNTECKYLLLKQAFEVLDVVRVQICVDSRNQRSQSAVLRLGAKHEGTLRRHRILSDGYIRDTWIASILDSEWPVVKERLEHFLHDKYV